MRTQICLLLLFVVLVYCKPCNSPNACLKFCLDKPNHKFCKLVILSSLLDGKQKPIKKHATNLRPDEEVSSTRYFCPACHFHDFTEQWLSDGNAVEKYTHAQAIQELEGKNIILTSQGNCFDRTNPNCTSLEQVNKKTIEGVISLAKISKCTIRIIAGTEVGHSTGTFSHKNGFKLHIAAEKCINDYIKELDDFDKVYTSSSGTKYVLVGNYWDVSFGTTDSSM